MSFDVDTLYNLLPAIYRIRDAEQGDSLKAILSAVIQQELPLKELLSVIGEQVAVIEEDMAQLYDDLFIETCAEWAIPYVADSIGYRLPYSVTAKTRSIRSDVANTLHYRRRKGTASGLEPQVHDITGWNARVVEFFQLLSTTQYMNHLRPDNRVTVDVRRWKTLASLNTPFDHLTRSVDIRRVVSGLDRGRYNVSNIGIFVWRLQPYSLTNSPAFRIDSRRYLFSPLGQNMQLFNRPQKMDGTTFFAEPINLPMPISRRVLHEDLNRHAVPKYYGNSIVISVDGKIIPPGDIVVHDLSDGEGDTWAHMPRGQKIALDPVLGRIAFPKEQETPVLVTCYYVFSADIGGGEYNRAASINTQLRPVIQVPASIPNIQMALDAIDRDGAVEIVDSGRYEDHLSIVAMANEHIELRAADGKRPSMVLGNRTPFPELEIEGERGAEVTLNGLLISGGSLHVRGELSRLNLRHCTLVPGLSLSRKGRPQYGSRPSLIVESEGTVIEIDHCITGGLRIADGCKVVITNSIVDATAERKVAYAAAVDDEAMAQGLLPGATLHVENSTIIGRVSTVRLELAQNTIFLTHSDENDRGEPVYVLRRQEGCVRFCYLPLASRVPHRYQCQPPLAADADTAANLRPLFTSLHYGTPGYCQLSRVMEGKQDAGDDPLGRERRRLYRQCPIEILQGADDESEMGAFHDLFQPQRETNLRVRLDEYLRFGLEAAIFYMS